MASMPPKNILIIALGTCALLILALTFPVINKAIPTATKVTGTLALAAGNTIARTGIKPPIVKDIADAMAACHALVSSSLFKPNCNSR